MAVFQLSKVKTNTIIYATSVFRYDTCWNFQPALRGPVLLPHVRIWLFSWVIIY